MRRRITSAWARKSRLVSALASVAISIAFVSATLVLELLVRR